MTMLDTLDTLEAALRVTPSLLRFMCGHSIAMTYGMYESLDDDVDLSRCPACHKTHPFVLSMIGSKELLYPSRSVLHSMFMKEDGHIVYYMNYDADHEYWIIYDTDNNIAGWLWKD
jgi:hypothetical protein